MAWTKTLALGLLVGPVLLASGGCVVSVDDDPDDNFGGTGGGLSGSGGRAGDGGSTAGGTGGSAGSSGSAGDANGGTGGAPFPTPTCDAEAGDDDDECARCLKQNCCTPWLGCDDQTCADEFFDVSECVTAIQFATSEDLGMCISDSSTTDDGFVQQNTQTLIECAIAPGGDAGIDTLCSTACFGSEIFPE